MTDVGMLAADRCGPADDAWRPGRVVFVHGFTQTRRSWDSVVAALADRKETIAVDAPGHGESAELRLDVRIGARWLGATGGRAAYVGYSMGGRFALQLAVDRPGLVDRLVLVSSTPGIADPAVRAQRRADDERRAAALERDGVEAFLERWLALPLFAHLPRSAARLEERLANTSDGLASSLRLAGVGSQAPLWDRLDRLTMPVLLVAGSLDEKFVAIAEQVRAAVPSARVVVIPGAGHTVHLEQPDAFLDVLTLFLR